jgi:hypothetical protein
MIGTDKDRTEIDSQLLVSFSYANGVVLYYFWQIMENWGKK